MRPFCLVSAAVFAGLSLLAGHGPSLAWSQNSLPPMAAPPPVASPAVAAYDPWLGEPAWPLLPDPLGVSAAFGLLPDPLAVLQPIGHEIISTGPNSYIYRPIQGDELAEPAPAAEAPLPPHPPDAAQSARTAFAVAVLAFRAGRCRGALAELDQVASADPDHAHAWLLRSHALVALGHYAQAAESLSQAIERLPPEDWGRFTADFSDWYPSVSAYGRQLRRLEQFVGENPDRPEGHILLGYHYGFLGYRHEALQQLEAALELDERDPLARRLRDLFAGEQRDLGGPREF